MEKVLAITSCPVGVAHTYMAAENLEKAGKSMGIDLKVETHGSIGVENEFTAEDISEAKGIIIAADTEIDKSRFGGKQIIEVGVRAGINRPEELIKQILDNQGKTVGQGASGEDSETKESSSSGNPLYRSLMNGVSYMVPFVVTGGLLIAIALSIGGVPSEAGLVIPEGSIWAGIESIGGAAMDFMVPILAGYIAMSIADRPGLVPGMVGGFIANNGAFYGSEAGTGFLGGIVAGFLAGYIAKYIRKIPVPKAMESVMPIIFIPIFSTLLVGLIFIYVIGSPISVLFVSLTNWLASLEGASSILLATIIGAMIAFDMGGPFNKVAFLFGSGLIAEGTYSVMGAVAVAVSVPPIALGLATHFLPTKFEESDKQAGTAALAMGFFGITEGAIPFAAQDPLRVIPSIMIGSIAGSIVGMLTGVGGHVAHGGPIVAVLGAIDHVIWYFIALTVGVVVTLFMLRLLKQDIVTETTAEENEVPTADTDTSETESEVAKDPADATSATETTDGVSLVSLTNKDLFNLDLKAEEKNAAMEEMLEMLPESFNKEEILKGLLERESQETTGLGEGIAIPHTKSKYVDEAQVLFARSNEGVNWESLDGAPSNLVFMILVPEEQKGTLHLQILQMLARTLMDSSFKENILAAENKDEVYEILSEVKS